MGSPKMKLILVITLAVALFNTVSSSSSPIFSHGARHARSPQFGGLLGECNGKCNRQGYKVGRALAISGAVVGSAGLLTNNRELQKVGGSALAGGVGIKTFSKLFGK